MSRNGVGAICSHTQCCGQLSDLAYGDLYLCIVLSQMLSSSDGDVLPSAHKSFVPFRDCFFNAKYGLYDDPFFGVIISNCIRSCFGQRHYLCSTV
jgi:hypothetical protein